MLVKDGCEDDYLKAVEAWASPDGMSDRYLAKTGERRYCFVGLWESEEKLIAARPFMICLLYTSPSPRDRTRYRMPSSA